MPYWFDGNNLIGQSAASSQARPRIRREFLSNLNGYYKSGGGRFLVYFDGDDPGHAMPPPGVRIRYSAPVSADDAIIRRLHEISRPGEVIVVTNDFDLQNRCRNTGSKVMSWPQFTSKMKNRKVAGKGKSNMEQPVDVEDWAQYFGFDKEEIQ